MNADAIIRGFRTPPVFLRVTEWGAVGVFPARGGYRVSSWTFAPGRGGARRLVNRRDHGTAGGLEAARRTARGVGAPARTNPPRARKGRNDGPGPLFAYQAPPAPDPRDQAPAYQVSGYVEGWPSGLAVGDKVRAQVEGAGTRVYTLTRVRTNELEAEGANGAAVRIHRGGDGFGKHTISSAAGTRAIVGKLERAEWGPEVPGPINRAATVRAAKRKAARPAAPASAAPASSPAKPSRAPKPPKVCTPPVVVAAHERGCPKPKRPASTSAETRKNPAACACPPSSSRPRANPPKPPTPPAHLVERAALARKDWTGHPATKIAHGRDPAVEAAPGGVLVDLGELVAVEYRARKRPDGPLTGTYRHEFGEEGGRRPRLTADARARLRIVGGDYYIRPEGIRD